mgnify:FL=1
MNNIKACIFNIQKYSIHDGPGIRTVVFFKGCPLRCMWCSNPESQDTKIQILCDKTSCSDSNNSLPKEAKLLTVNEVMNEVMKDKVFYEESNGGVTLSGGEVLMQHEFAAQLLKLLKDENVHTAIETTGFTSKEIFSGFIKNVDLLLFDIKHYDREKHFKATKVYNDLIIENLKTAINMGKEVIVRIPVIPGINSSLEDAEGFCTLLNPLGAKEVNLLPFHQYGQKKYTLLNMPYAFENVPQLHEEDLSEYKNIFIENGFNCYF